MAIKVGDIVNCRGRHVRVMKLSSPAVRLSYFGRVVKTLTDSDLVHTNDTPELFVGDEVTIHPIHKDEYLYYGAGWVNGRMDDMIGKSYKVEDVRYDDERGQRVRLDGLWFCTYHLERVPDYDFV